MPELKTQREINEIIEELPETKQYALALLCKWWIENPVEGIRDLTESRIDNDFMFPMRWELFEMQFDSELLYEYHDVEEFIDKVYTYFNQQAKGE